MNAGILSTVALFFIFRVFDPEGTVSVDAQIILGGILFGAVCWAKSKISKIKYEGFFEARKLTHEGFQHES